MIAIKDSSETLDFSVDFGPVLAPGEIITGYTASATGVTLNSFSLSGNVETVWVSGGTRGLYANVVYQITTNQGRTLVETLRLQIGPIYAPT